jgi:hypothetical protein
MRKPQPLRATLAAGLTLAATVPADPAAAQRVEVGNAAAVVGDVKMSNATIPRPRAIQRRERLAWGDRVDTGKKSQLQILLLDRSTFGVGASSRVQIDRFVYDPDAGRSVFATFAKGALRFFSGREGTENSANVQTPAGRIGIRGTAVDMLVGEEAEEIGEDEDFVDDIDGVDSDEDEATLVVLRGPGAATAGGLTVGRAEVEGAGVTVVLDQPGLAAYIPRNGAAPIGPFQISNKGLAKVQDELAPAVARAADGNDAETAAAVAGAAVLACVLLVCRDDDDDNRRRPTSTQPTSTQPTSRGNNNSNSSDTQPKPPR